MPILTFINTVLQSSVLVLDSLLDLVVYPVDVLVVPSLPRDSVL